MYSGRTDAWESQWCLGLQGTRVPVKALFENLEDGARVDDFLEWFPGVTREHVEAVLRHAERSLVPAVNTLRPGDFIELSFS